MKRNVYLPLILSITFLLSAGSALARPDAAPVRQAIPGLTYLNPLPGAEWVSPRSTLTFGFTSPRITRSLRIRALGSVSGNISGRMRQTENGCTVVFVPDHPFAWGETVSVRIGVAERGTTTYRFRIAPRPPSAEALDAADRMLWREWTGDDTPPRPDPLNETSLPDRMPGIVVTNNGGEADGVLYIQAFNQSQMNLRAYNLVIDNDGNVLYYDAPDGQTPMDFHPHDSLGLVSQFRYPNRTWTILDTTWTVVDTIESGNGYRADPHELRMLEDGHVYLIAQDYRTIDMSEIVAGGDPEATVIGSVVQELDADRNVVFEWRSLDYIPVTETDTVEVDLTSSVIDYIHTNSIDIDADDNLLISSRLTSEITKIDHSTGNILWRLGGPNNQFTFLNDTAHPGFHLQHDARWLDNGNLMLFNNGGSLNGYESGVKEYTLDEENLTATLDWSYEDPSAALAWAMGSAQRFANGNTLIGWGTAPGSEATQPVASEVDSAGNLLWQVHFNDPENRGYYSYRAYRSSLTGSASAPYITAEAYTDSVVVYFNYFGHDSVTYDLYGGIDPDSPQLLASTTGPRQILTGLEDNQVYHLYAVAHDPSGGSTETSNEIEVSLARSGVNEEVDADLPGMFRIADAWPNPFNPSTSIRVNVPRTMPVELTVVNLLGRTVATLHHGRLTSGSHTFLLNGNRLTSGAYFVRLTSAHKQDTRKVVLLH